MKYVCEMCSKELSNIKRYCNHINKHDNKDRKTFNISEKILDYLIEYNIELDQCFLEEIIDDSDMLEWWIKNGIDECFALDILDLLDKKKCEFSINTYNDDEDRIREYLFSIGKIPTLDYDIYKIIDEYGYDSWEFDVCHYTNNSLLMRVIKKGWEKLATKLLDYTFLYNLNYQNFTNAYEMAIKYNMPDLANKIKNHEKCNLKII